MTLEVLANARLRDGRTVDIDLAEGRIEAIREPGGQAPQGALVHRLEGRLVVPSFVDGHCHLDKTLFGSPWYGRQRRGSILASIEAERTLRRTLRYSVKKRAEALLRSMIGFGTGVIRSHVDIDLDVRLQGLHDLSEIREEWTHSVAIQLVAFPQSGVLRSPGVADLLEAAMSEGADVVGGLDPGGIDGDVDGQLDIVFRVAERHSARVDIHLHDSGDLGIAQLAAIAERTLGLGMLGRVTVSHAYALAEASDNVLSRIADALASAGVAIVTSGPARATPPIRRLVEAGVEVIAGSDNVRDPWSPFGRGDMLERASIVAYQAGFVSDEDLELAFELITDRARRVIGLEEVSLRIGAPANLVAVEASCIAEAVAGYPGDRHVWHEGVLVAKPDSTPGPSRLELD